jgi:hypothetical protein
MTFLGWVTLLGVWYLAWGLETRDEILFHWLRVKLRWRLR